VRVKTYDVVVYKHVNGEWIPKYTVTEMDLEEMKESDFVEKIKTFTFDEWAELCNTALELRMKISELLDRQ
jgi:hypothetical protein